MRSIKTPPQKLSLPDVAGGRGRSIVPTVRSSQSTGKGVQRGSEGTEKTSNGTALHVSVRGVRQLASALDVGRFLEMWNIRETHPKGGPVRTLVRYRMCAPDTKLAHILRKVQVLLHRKGTEQEGPAPPTNNERKIQSQLEQRRKKVEGK